MQARIVSIADMTPDLVSAWNTWCAPDGDLISPYLRFEFAEAVARTRSDVRVGILEDGSELLGFFAHHRPRHGVVRPVGAPMSDYQGVISADYSRLSPTRLTKAVGASALVYDNWYCPRGGYSIGRRERVGSVICDLRSGFDVYWDRQRKRFKDHFKKSARRQRAAERDFGPVRVELGDADGQNFAQLLDWKQTQYRETGKLNVFGFDWVERTLRDLHAREGSDFGGLTASLWFGDRLAAVEFGLAAGGVYHSWFPAYDPELAKYSPGLLLLHGMFEQAHDRGIDRIDLGHGGGHYKKYYTSYEVPLDHGRVLVPGLASTGIKTWEAAEHAVAALPSAMANLPGRIRRRWAQASAFQPALGPRLVGLAQSISL